MYFFKKILIRQGYPEDYSRSNRSAQDEYYANYYKRQYDAYGGKDLVWTLYVQNLCFLGNGEHFCLKLCFYLFYLMTHILAKPTHR